MLIAPAPAHTHQWWWINDRRRCKNCGVEHGALADLPLEGVALVAHARERVETVATIDAQIGFLAYLWDHHLITY